MNKNYSTAFGLFFLWCFGLWIIELSTLDRSIKFCNKNPQLEYCESFYISINN